MSLYLDLYHLDSLYVLWKSGKTQEQATFDLYFRRAPFGQKVALIAGVDEALEFASHFSYSMSDLDYIASLHRYDLGFLKFIDGLTFTGTIYAIPDGTICPPNVPILRVDAPFAEALMLESGLLQAINSYSIIATKARLICNAAEGLPVAEFAFRRALDPHITAKASYIGGCVSTSFLEAGKLYGIPVSGTVPHALIQGYDTETAAFTAIGETFKSSTLLLDTYEPHQAIQTAVHLFSKSGKVLAAVRIDGGDLAELIHYCRKQLNNNNFRDTKILASGDLDELEISFLVKNTPVDGFGVGTELGIPRQALGAVYKLVQLGDKPKIKVSGEKTTFPGKKLVYSIGGRMHVALEEEEVSDNIINKVGVLRGYRTGIRSSLHAIRSYASTQPDYITASSSIRIKKLQRTMLTNDHQ